VLHSGKYGGKSNVPLLKNVVQFNVNSINVGKYNNGGMVE
jgi:hypothetical protein